MGSSSDQTPIEPAWDIFEGLGGVPGAVVICTHLVAGQEQLRKTMFFSEPTPEATAQKAIKMASLEQNEPGNERIIVCTVIQEWRRKRSDTFRTVLPFKRINGSKDKHKRG